MVTKKSKPSPAPVSSASSTTITPSPITTTPSTAHTRSSSKASSSSSNKNNNNNDVQQIFQRLWNNYTSKTPQRVKLIDAFMFFLVVVGALQFVYCLIGGNYPFNAFLSGFSATVGQFVLTASLRIQTNPENAAEFTTVSSERAFADFIFGSLLLHFFCVNFIN